MKAGLRSFDLDIGLQTNNLQIVMSILNSPCYRRACVASEGNLSSYFAMLHWPWEGGEGGNLSRGLSESES